jgi:hypothetical protein
VAARAETFSEWKEIINNFVAIDGHNNKDLPQKILVRMTGLQCILGIITALGHCLGLHPR